MSQEMPRVLVVDDEPDIRELLNLTLSRMGLEVDTAEDLGEARQALQAKQYNFCLTDMRLPDGNGLDLVEEISEQFPNLPTAMITAHGKVEDAVYALKMGAFDFVSKPVDLAVLRKLVNTALKLGSSKPGVTDAPGATATDAPSELDRLTGISPAIQQCKAMIGKLARSQAPVLVSGESGSGKELAARLIHDLGPRADGPFIPVNCGAIPTELMESEFFGHKKGSFTGAAGDKDGLFQAADGGTLLLDEVADLPLHMQVKLLRVIQEKAVMPIGARQEVPVDVRILSRTHKADVRVLTATNADLQAMIDGGSFRRDLFFRLNTVEIHIPPLRERKEDIPALALRYLDEQCRRHGRSLDFSEQAMATLEAHDWPGNVRELAHTVERAVLLSTGDHIEAQDLALRPAGESRASGGEVMKLDDAERLFIRKALDHYSGNGC